MRNQASTVTPPLARCEGERLYLEGGLTMDTVPALLAQARAVCAQGSVRVVDFSGVTALDSAAIALAIELRRASEGTLRFENLPLAARNLASLYSVSDQLDIAT